MKKSLPETVVEAIIYENNAAYWICPNCKCTFEREYQSYCDRCGQRLKWKSLKDIKYISYKTYNNRKK